MHISAMEEYGLRCALQLARHHGDGPMAASKIAEKEGISLEYVSKLMHLFRKAGLVQAVRGVQGGFVLDREPAQITLREVVQTVSAKKDSNASFCSQYSGQQDSCANLGECTIRPVWTTLYNYFDEILKELTLADLLKREVTLKTQVTALAEAKAKQFKEMFHEQPML